MEALPLPGARPIALRVRWIVVAVVIVVAAAITSLVAVHAMSGPTVKIQTPVVQPAPIDPNGCGLHVRSGPC
jgi:hypothetical protein